MRELDECLRLSRKIAETKEKIEELKALAMSPRNQIISDMPKGGGTINAAESYIIRLEKYEKTLEALRDKRSEEWLKVCEAFAVYNHRKAEIKTLLWLRFCNGYSWKRCIDEMAKVFPNETWNANKCFRLYRGFLHKTCCKK